MLLETCVKLTCPERLLLNSLLKDGFACERLIFFVLGLSLNGNVRNMEG